ncbi:hypothetical protein HanIR_Chr17g0854771 [Helianthus annuus]|nr:hypothetical protein HanIR_Chr17g0854771 [Helianthus annuus]
MMQSTRLDFLALKIGESSGLRDVFSLFSFHWATQSLPDQEIRFSTSKKYGGATSAALKNGLMTSTTTPKPYFHGYFLVKTLG